MLCLLLLSVVIFCVLTDAILHIGEYKPLDEENTEDVETVFMKNSRQTPDLDLLQEKL